MWQQINVQKWILNAKNTLHLSNISTKVATTKPLWTQLWRQRDYGWTPLLLSD